MMPDGKPQIEEVPYKHDHPNLSFVSKHKLSSQSHPAEILDVFVPFHTNKYSKASRGEFPSKLKLGRSKYTNAKAILANAGQLGNDVFQVQAFFNVSNLSSSQSVHSEWTESISFRGDEV
jgi:hypothetical protein